MRILVSGSGDVVRNTLVQSLATRHDVHAMAIADLRDRERAEGAVQNRDAVVQLIPQGAPGLSDIDLLDIATRGTYNVLSTMPAGRLILVTSLRPFERYPATWRVTEQWAPRPTSAVADLAPYLAELTAREVSRVRPVEVIVLRLGEVVADVHPHDGIADPRWLHVDDAIHAIERALLYQPEPEEAPSRWRVFQIPGGGVARFPLGLAAQPPFSYAPRHEVGTTPPRVAAVPDHLAPPAIPATEHSTPRRVVIFGAGGPLGAITAENLAPDHLLRLTDIRPLAEIAAGSPQSPGAPLPRVLPEPHEEQRVDVSDPEQVISAAEDMDAIINCSVIRPHPVNAFRVNTLGAYTVARAAVANGIHRIVHTGPVQFLLEHPSGYAADFDLSPEIPPRPGDNLYFLTKYLGQEVCRIFAEEHSLSIPTMLFGNFVNPAHSPERARDLYPFTISWADAATAMRAALHVATLPRPFEVFHVNADLPHGKYPNDKAKRLLDWQPRDRLEDLWRRQDNAGMSNGESG